MKPLTSIPSSWRDLIAPAFRFELVMNGAAALDHETGLIWERAPTTLSAPWFTAVRNCSALQVGDRMGWRLPAVEELGTLIDPTQTDPALPPAHPFAGLRLGQLDQYWTMSNHPTNQGRDATQLNLAFGAVNHGDKESGAAFVWCVRGGIGPNPDPKP
jgi:hypothetical protein